MEKICVYLVDDHPAVRDGVRSALLRSGFISIVGEADDAYRLFVDLEAVRPEVILLDIGLPDGSGIDLIEKIRMKLPHVRILMLSMYNRIDYIVESLRNGARGFVTKETSPSRIAEAIERVHAGEYFFDGTVLDAIVGKLLENSYNIMDVSDSAYATLTAREQEIMRLLAQGNSVRKVAQMLFISKKTVENHRTSIFKKLNINNSVELVHYATRIGLIDID
ncbi:response regulator [Sediminispirochaeta bajacaliforniensis]|uniref:response regulator n=1 Tax=Sediminispirochaeta bajacaliforniensis TaxID=148 RepID=UPI00037530F7|nr:response regulator transcription factor [Sediminispirochaeta bajacaliforniensis]